MSIDFVGTVNVVAERLHLENLEVTMGYRDCSSETYQRFRRLFIGVWEAMPHEYQRLIGNQIRRMESKAGLLGVRPGIWLLPGINSDSRAYVTARGGFIVFCSLQLEDCSSDPEYRHVIRHELAHVWQFATGMHSGILTKTHIETLADWLATYRLAYADWRPLND